MFKLQWRVYVYIFYNKWKFKDDNKGYLSTLLEFTACSGKNENFYYKLNTSRIKRRIKF